MIETHNRVRFEEASIDDLSSWFPVFGNWCGPGWSAGQRNKVVEINCVDSKTPLLDDLCCIHDKAYGEATGNHDEVNLKLQADLTLLNEVNKLDQTTLSWQEKAYIAGINVLFAIKIGIIENTIDNAETIDIEELNKLLQTVMKEAKTEDNPEVAKNQAAHEPLRRAFNLETLLNSKLIKRSTSSAAQKKEQMERISKFFNTKLSVDTEERDCSFKQTLFANHFAQPTPSEAESKPKSSRVRNYV